MAALEEQEAKAANDTKAPEVPSGENIADLATTSEALLSEVRRETGTRAATDAPSQAQAAESAKINLEELFKQPFGPEGRFFDSSKPLIRDLGNGIQQTLQPGPERLVVTKLSPTETITFNPKTGVYTRNQDGAINETKNISEFKDLPQLKYKGYDLKFNGMATVDNPSAKVAPGQAETAIFFAPNNEKGLIKAERIKPTVEGQKAQTLITAENYKIAINPNAKSGEPISTVTMLKPKAGETASISYYPDGKRVTSYAPETGKTQGVVETLERAQDKVLRSYQPAKSMDIGGRKLEVTKILTGQANDGKIYSEVSYASENGQANKAGKITVPGTLMASERTTANRQTSDASSQDTNIPRQERTAERQERPTEAARPGKVDSDGFAMSGQAGNISYEISARAKGNERLANGKELERGQITAMSMRANNGSTYKFELDASDGRYKVSPANASATPGTIDLGGIKIGVDASGKVTGDLNITKNGEIRYSEGRKGAETYYCRYANGKTEVVDYKNWSRQIFGPDGQPTGKAEMWDGRNWSTNYRVSQGPNGQTVTDFFDANNPQEPRLRLVRDTSNGKDQTMFMYKDGRRVVTDWVEMTHTTFKPGTQPGQAQYAAGQEPIVRHYDGSSFREGTARKSPDGNGKIVEFKDTRPGAPLKAEIKANGDIITHYAHGIQMKDRDGRILAKTYPNGLTRKYAYDKDGDIYREAEFSGNQMVRMRERVGAETNTGMAAYMQQLGAERERTPGLQSVRANDNVPKGFNTWQETDLRTKASKRVVENIYHTADGTLRRERQGDGGVQISHEFMSNGSIRTDSPKGAQIEYANGVMELQAHPQARGQAPATVAVRLADGRQLTAQNGPLKVYADGTVLQARSADGSSRDAYLPNGSMLKFEQNQIQTALIPAKPQALVLNASEGQITTDKVGNVIQVKKAQDGSAVQEVYMHNGTKGTYAVRGDQTALLSVTLAGNPPTELRPGTNGIQNLVLGADGRAIALIGDTKVTFDPNTGTRLEQKQGQNFALVRNIANNSLNSVIGPHGKPVWLVDKSGNINGANGQSFEKAAWATDKVSIDQNTGLVKLASTDGRTAVLSPTGSSVVGDSTGKQLSTSLTGSRVELNKGEMVSLSIPQANGQFAKYTPVKEGNTLIGLTDGKNIRRFAPQGINYSFDANSGRFISGDGKPDSSGAVVTHSFDPESGSYMVQREWKNSSGQAANSSVVVGPDGQVSFFTMPGKPEAISVAQMRQIKPNFAVEYGKSSPGELVIYPEGKDKPQKVVIKADGSQQNFAMNTPTPGQGPEPGPKNAREAQTDAAGPNPAQRGGEIRSLSPADKQTLSQNLDMLTQAIEKIPQEHIMQAKPQIEAKVKEWLGQLITAIGQVSNPQQILASIDKVVKELNSSPEFQAKGIAINFGVNQGVAQVSINRRNKALFNGQFQLAQASASTQR